MGQKVNPLGFRLGITQKHLSQWFMKDTQYSQFVVEDFFLRKKISLAFGNIGVTEVTIARKLDQIIIQIKTPKPGNLLGGSGSRLEKVRQSLESELIKYRQKHFYFYKIDRAQILAKPKLAIHLVNVATPELEAAYIASFIAEQIEKRIPFRRAMKQAIQKAQRARVKGIKIQVSGRLNGAEIARSEWLREGRVPLQTLRANIDYSYQTAKTIYGIIGLKVWVFRGNATIKPGILASVSKIDTKKIINKD